MWEFVSQIYPKFVRFVRFSKMRKKFRNVKKNHPLIILPKGTKFSGETKN